MSLKYFSNFYRSFEMPLISNISSNFMSDFSKGLELSVYLNEHKTKSENKSMTNEYRYFLESNIVGVNRLFVLIYLNPDANSKRFKTQRYYLPKAIVENYNVISNRKTYLTRQLILL